MDSSTYTLRLKIPDRPPLIRVRSFERTDHLEIYARKLLLEWPECEAIEILDGDEVIELFVQSRPSA